MRQYLKRKLPDGFDRDMKLLLYSTALRRVVMGFLMVVRAIYFALLGFSPIAIGFLLSISTFVVAIRCVTFGPLSDRFGRKPFLLLGGFFAIIQMGIFTLSTDFWLLALAMVIGALGEGSQAGQPVVSGYIADKTNRRQRTQIFSTLAIADAVATMAGALTASLPNYIQKNLQLNIVEAHSPLFWIGAATSAISLMLIIPIKKAKPRSDGEIRVKRRFPRLKPKSVIGRYTLVRSTNGLAIGLIESLLPLYFFIRFGVGSEIIGPIYAVTKLFSIFSFLLIPRIVNRFGDTKTIIASRLLTAGLTAAFAITSFYPVAVALLVAFRTTIFFAIPIQQSFATSIVDLEETATAIGISSFSRMILWSIAPTAAGYMFEALSLSIPFLSGAGLMATNAILYQNFFQPKKS